MISDIDILDVLNKTDHSRLIGDVCTHLGLSNLDISNTRLAFRDPRLVAKNLLQLWRDRNGNAATREALLEKMEKVDFCKKAAGDLREEWKLK